ncbi:MAG: DUF4287 domain-containing protein [Ktedonobacterales bacterium]|nr:DUF4287 domain-containing protein [Ktedonobacterales bacterium]
MTFQAYLDAVQAKTGKTVDDFRLLASAKGLTEKRDILAWLKAEFALGHGHATAVAHVLANADAPTTTPSERIAAHFSGGKARWRDAYDALIARVNAFGADVTEAPTQTYISILRQGKKFAIIQPTTERLDIGIKLKGITPTERLTAAGTWNNMVTHRLRISDPVEIDDAVLNWLERAYAAA